MAELAGLAGPVPSDADDGPGEGLLVAEEQRRRSEEARRAAFDYTRPGRTERGPVPRGAERAVGHKGGPEQATPGSGIGVWLRRTWHQAWDVPEGDTRTPRRLGVASIVVALIPPIIPLYLFGGGFVAFGVSLVYPLIGVILGMRGAGLANIAAQSPLLPRIGWGLCLFELVTGFLGAAYGCATWHPSL